MIWLLLACHAQPNPAECNTPAFRVETFQNADKEQACVWLDSDAQETVIRVDLCLDSACFPVAEGWASALQYCVDNDKAHLYKFTILSCEPTTTQRT